VLLSLSSFHFAISPQGLGAELGDLRVEQPWEEEHEEEKEKRGGGVEGRRSRERKEGGLPVGTCTS